jgi:hypothetical protein
MCKYLSKVIEDFPEEITGVSATLAADHLFKVREDGRKLSEEQADVFHHTVYQLLFVANRACQDIQMALSFLTMQVQAPDEDDWGKLMRVLKYLKGTQYAIPQANIERRCNELCNSLVHQWITSNTRGLLRTNRKLGIFWI